MAITNLGAVGISTGGDYNPETVYKKYKVVSANGGSYMYINPTPAAGVPVTDTSHWQQIATIGGQDILDAVTAEKNAAIAAKVLAEGYAAQLAAGTASPAGTYTNLAALNDGTPTAPNTAKIYITLNDGKWCYHNGSAWVAGGVYQATERPLDTTLSVSGMAADAKVTGDKVGELKSALEYKADKVYGGDATATYYEAAGGKSWTVNGLYVNQSDRAASNPIRYTPDMKSADVTSGYRVTIYGNNEGAGHPITRVGYPFVQSISLSNFPYDYIFAIIRSEPAGNITTDLSNVLSISKYNAAYEFALKKDLDSIKLRCDISGTIQTPVYDSNGQLVKIEHTSDGSVVRTDTFTYSGNVITENRTLSNGKTLEYTYYLETNIVGVN